VFQFHDLADLIIEKDSFIEKIREKFEIGKWTNWKYGV
jgi:hypothetical protein